MDIIEFATKTLGLQLNSAQIELLHIAEVTNNSNSFICLPRNNGRQMCYNILERYKGYKQRLEEENNKWKPIKIRPLTEEEKEEYSEYDYEFIYDCELPYDGQEVLITTKYGYVEKTTFYTDCGSYFEQFEDEDDVLAWMELPKAYKP